MQGDRLSMLDDQKGVSNGGIFLLIVLGFLSAFILSTILIAWGAYVRTVRLERRVSSAEMHIKRDSVSSKRDLDTVRITARFEKARKFSVPNF
jgi:hypothetical protein